METLFGMRLMQHATGYGLEFKKRWRFSSVWEQPGTAVG
jgi:hypothetical protein